jgi:FG-GAP repeat
MRRRWKTLVLALAAALTGTVLLTVPAAAETELVCPGSVPANWIHTDSFSIWNVCGAGPVNPGVVTQWEITNLAGKYKDDILEMCIDDNVPVPTGWAEIARSVVWYRCGLLLPGPGAQQNVRTIKCLNCPVRPPDPPAPTPTEGGLDSVSNNGVVNGWARDTGRPGQSIRVDYYIDGTAATGVPAGGAVADAPRSDIQPGNHGLRFTIPAAFFDGRLHTLYAYGIDATGDAPVLLASSPRLFILPKQPIGFLERIDPAGNVVGWTLDPSLLGLANPNAVTISIDGFTLPQAPVPADVPRPDVNQAYGYPGNHGFRWPIPNDFRDGNQHTIRVTATDLTGDGARELPGSPATFTLDRRDAPVDFTGDARSDLAVWRPSDGVWWWQTVDGGTSAVDWGQAGDRPVAGDYDGDGTTDHAVYRDGTWWILPSSTLVPQVVNFGLADDKPVPGDYDGDGRTDPAVFRPSDQTWYVSGSRDGFTAVQYGLSTDRPVPGDYDGDGRTDLAVYRPLFGAWIVRHSSTGQDVYTQFGVSSDRVVPADYDGDGSTDRAVYRPSTGTWHILQSGDGRYRTEAFGLAGDQLAPADYDGDLRADVAVFRPSTGTWYVRRSRDGDLAVTFGSPGDLAVAGVLAQ